MCNTQINYLPQIETIRSLNNTVERVIKLMEDFHGNLTNMRFELIQNNRKIYPDYKKVKWKIQF
jgi:hypothetical protein